MEHGPIVGPERRDGAVPAAGRARWGVAAAARELHCALAMR